MSMNKDFYTLLDELDNVHIPQYRDQILEALRKKGLPGIFSANAIAGAPGRKRLRELFKRLDAIKETGIEK
jgi:hypothetical protein